MDAAKEVLHYFPAKLHIIENVSKMAISNLMSVSQEHTLAIALVKKLAASSPTGELFFVHYFHSSRGTLTYSRKVDLLFQKNHLVYAQHP